jgi:hypothetical protein
MRHLVFGALFVVLAITAAVIFLFMVLAVTAVVTFRFVMLIVATGFFFVTHNSEFLLSYLKLIAIFSVTVIITL